MVDITKANAQADAVTQIVDPMNVLNVPNGAPYGSDRGLTYCVNAVLDFYSYSPAESFLALYLSGNIGRSQLMTRIQALANWYARTISGIYGLTGSTDSGEYVGMEPPFTTPAIFFVNPTYHSTHYATVTAAIAADTAPELNGNINRTTMATYFNRMVDIISANVGTDSMDLRVCHSSCHSNCHGSRGRR